MEVIYLKLIAKTLRLDKMARAKGRQRVEAEFRPLALRHISVLGCDIIGYPRNFYIEVLY